MGVNDKLNSKGERSALEDGTDLMMVTSWTVFARRFMMSL